ncbi:hypothetical protein HPB47_004359 [Ixodes persulcatus]|uniref:Uncharacterized protein n=1 Tax=Ixodes persulcatus TaxID=34615 RepID=A0AC60PG04_IXOPE|nr:hypothetical protein HPB47_004359 [Ixodes persulcatus]
MTLGVEGELRKREEKALRASSCDSPEDEGDAKTETTPGESSQLIESGAEMPDKVVQQSSQDLDHSDRHPCGFWTKPTVPSQESKRPTRREVIEISFDEINRSCLVRFRSPDFRPFTESRGQENDDECASVSESSSTFEDGRPKVGHPKEPATGGGCAGKGPSGVTIEPGRDKVHLKTSSCPRQGTAETKNSDVVTRQRPRPMKKRERRISVVRSGSDAPCKKRPGKRDERHFKKKKRSSLLGGGKLQDLHPIEPRTHSSSASKEPGGGNNEPGTTQRGSKRRQGSSPVVQPGIPLDGVDSSRDLSCQTSRETASFRGPVWTAPPQDTLPGGGGAVVKGYNTPVPRLRERRVPLAHVDQSTRSHRPAARAGALENGALEATFVQAGCPCLRTAAPFVYLPVAQRTPTNFHGEVHEYVEDWLQYYEPVARHNRWTTEQRLKNLYFALEGTARQWFQNHEASLTSWDTCLDGLKATFTNQPCRELVEDLLRTRTQGLNESITSFVEDVLRLSARVEPQTAEEKKLRPHERRED